MSNEEHGTVNEELRHRNQDAAELSNDLANLLASIQIPIIMLGRDLRIRCFTSMAAKLLNLIATDVGRPFGDIKPRIQAADLEQLICEVVDTLAVKECEVQDVQGHWYNLAIRPYRTLDNKIDGAVITIVDVDTLKRSEQRIIEAEAHLRAILDTAADGVITIDDHGVIQSFNKAAEQMFGYLVDEVRGKNISLLMPTPYRDEHDRYLAHYKTTGEKKIIGIGREVAGQRKDGTTFPLQLAVSEVLGERRIFTGIVRDITLQREAADALLRERDFAEGLIETAQVIVLVLDSEGRIVRFNAFMEEVSGYRRADLIGQDWFTTFLPERDRPAIRQLFQKALSEQAVRGNMNPIVTGKGTERLIQWWAKPLTDLQGGKVLLCIGHDITELKEAQERALQNERLAAIGQLSAGLAHESRNALQRSQACLEMLSREVQELPRAMDFIARIQKAQDLLLELYEEVRSYAAPLKLQCRRCNLGRLVQEVWGHLDADREGKTVQFRSDAGSLDLHCEVDPSHIDQVFRNILENALQAVPDPGEIDVVWSEVELNGKPALRIALRNNGPRLTDEEKERIFQAFYTTKTHGTGLGMTIAKRIVDAHHGLIEVGAGATKGAEILISLPRGKP